MRPGTSSTYKWKFIILVLCLLGSVSLQAQINIRTHYMRGRQQLASQEFTQAIQTFNIILQYDPGHANALFYRGLAKFQLSDFSGAEADLTRSIRIKPYKTEALYYRALLKVERSQYMEAFRDVQRAIELDDRHPEYFITRGWLHFEYGDTTGAITDYKKAIELDPYLDHAHLNLATIYTRQGRYEVALAHCDSAATINPYNPGCQLTRGNVFQLQEKFVDAIIQFEQVIKEDSMNVRAWFYTAICHQALGNYDVALEAYDRTINLNRNNALGYYNRGLLQLENDRYNEALVDFDLVVSLSPKNIYAYYIRGIIKSRLEDFAGAEEDFSKAIDLYPNLIHAYRDRSITRMAQNDQKGYAEDKNTVDSLLNIKVPGFDLSEISYLKTITDFNADFTPVDRVLNSKVQYSDEGVSMIPMFHIVLRAEQYDQSFSPVRDLPLPQLDPQTRYMLEVKNYEYSMPDEKTGIFIEALEKYLPENPQRANEIILKSLVLGWQMKYRDAIELVDSNRMDLSDNYLAVFNQGNYNLAIAEIITSIETQDIYSMNDNNTIKRYYQLALEDYNKALEINPEFVFTRFNRGIVHSLNGDLDKSMDDYSWCISRDPEFGEAYYNRGLIKIFLKDPAAGCQDLSKAGELGVKTAYPVIYKYCNNE